MVRYRDGSAYAGMMGCGKKGRFVYIYAENQIVQVPMPNKPRCGNPGITPSPVLKKNIMKEKKAKEKG